mgnify:CR=1 FL=1
MDIWDIPRTSKMIYILLLKPIELLSKAVNNSSKTGNLVLDTFGGSGSTLIACEQLNRKCYMVGKEPFYCQIIIDRWEDYTGNKAKLIS